tara:strand:+ start:531 stop:893 length:363 start_codon:yes stop_codon:yes gene_type:complete
MKTALQEYQTDYIEAVEEGNAPDYGTMLGIKAVAGNYGTAILARFSEDRYLSLYFNQHDAEGDCWGNVGGECEAPNDCEYGWCGSDRYAVLQDADEWLSTMSTCGIAGEWDWTESHPSVV